MARNQKRKVRVIRKGRKIKVPDTDRFRIDGIDVTRRHAGCQGQRNTSKQFRGSKVITFGFNAERAAGTTVKPRKREDYVEPQDKLTSRFMKRFTKPKWEGMGNRGWNPGKKK